MQRLADDLVGDMRAVEVARVDVIDTVFDRSPQHCDRAGAVLRRPQDAFARELHGPVAQPLDAAPAEGERSRLADIDHVVCLLSLPCSLLCDHDMKNPSLREFAF